LKRETTPIRLTLVSGVHDKGRALRLYANPDMSEFWLEARDAGCDFVNTDELEGLSAAFAPQDPTSLGSSAPSLQSAPPGTRRAAMSASCRSR
jgi:hypothetical protein